MSQTSVQHLLNQLLTEDLSAVTFVRDYLQLQFNPPPIINVYSICSVSNGNFRVQFGEPAFANAIIAQIGKQVRSVSQLPTDILVIEFVDGSTIEIPFGEGTFASSEAFEFFGRDHEWGVWPE
jgi:hypothetical protein